MRKLSIAIAVMVGCTLCWQAPCSRGQAKDEALPLIIPTPSDTSKSALPRAADGSDRIRQLQMEIEALRRARASANAKVGEKKPLPASDERAKLSARLAELIELLKARKAAAPPPPPPPAAAAKPSAAPAVDPARPVNRIRLVQNLYRSGETVAALRAMQMIEPASLTNKEAALIRYLKASCHRKLGETDKAREIYREIAASKDDAFLAECAAWQLRTMEIRQGLAAQLDTTGAKGSIK